MNIGNGFSLKIKSYDYTFVTSFSHTNSIFHMKNLLHTPLVPYNLILVDKLCLDNNAIVEFHATRFFVKEEYSKRVIARGILVDELYKLEGEVCKQFPSFIASIDNSCNKSTFSMVLEAYTSF